MTHAEFHRAMLDDPDDDLVRLVFADWLNEQGEADRAEFVRLGVLSDRARASAIGSAAHSEGRGLGTRAEAAFLRAWPAEYAVPRGIVLGHQLGLARVEFYSHNRWTSSRLAWLPQALAHGWIGAIRASIHFAGAFRPELPGLPLDAAIPQNAPDAVPPTLAYPNLVALAMDAADLTAATAAGLPNCKQLRTVTLYAYDALQVETAVRLLTRVPKLRRVNLHGPLNLEGAAPVFGALTRLTLYRNGIADPGVLAFAAANPSVSVGLPT